MARGVEKSPKCAPKSGPATCHNEDEADADKASEKQTKKAKMLTDKGMRELTHTHARAQTDTRMHTYTRTHTQLETNRTTLLADTPNNNSNNNSEQDA